MSETVLGSEFAGYRMEEVVGRGGMGVVYRATDLSLNRPVALKLIADEISDDAEFRERFKREARLMAAIDHPNVIPVYAAGEQDGHLYLVMRYVDGTDLQKVLVGRGRLSPGEAVRIVDQVGRALDAAHQRGLVHRDIKPANVLLMDQHVYLSDFGITRLIDERTRFTDSGKWVGTLNYMSPEHLRGEPTDGLSDVYSLACLLYTCLTGAPPFDRETPAATITAQLHDRPPRVSQVANVPKQLDAVIARGLAKRPKDRYQSAGELVNAALRALQSARGGPRLARRLAGSTREPDAAAGGGAERLHKEPETDARLTRIIPPTTHTVVAGEEETVVASGGARRDDTERTVVMKRSRRAARAMPRRAWLAAVGALLAAAAIVVVILAASSGSSAPAGPLTSSEISAAVHQFSVAYSHRDTRALSRLLAVDVTRVDPTSVERGRAAVVAEYQQQFTTKPVPGSYVLTDLKVTPGWAGRANGTYTLTLKGGGKLHGDVVFGIERAGGDVRIGLIATR